METTIKVTYSNRATIPTGIAYENQAPFYQITKEIKCEDNVMAEEIAHLELERIKNHIDALIDNDFRRMKDYRLKDQLRVNEDYRLIDGIKYPRVTKIITPDTPRIPHIEDHAELGTHLDSTMKRYIDTGIFDYVEFKDKGNVNVKWDDIYNAMNYWLKEHGEKCKFDLHSLPVISKKHVYSGEVDAGGTFEGIPAIFDFKKTEKISKTIAKKYFMQLAAYILALEEMGVAVPKIMVIISPFNPPLVSDEIEKHQGVFLQARNAFKERFGV